MMPTLNDAMTYLGIEPEYADERITQNVSDALSAAIGLLRGGIGADADTVFAEDSRARQLVLIYTDDLYSERTLSSAKANAAQRRLADSLELQLRMEYAKAGGT